MSTPFSNTSIRKCIISAILFLALSIVFVWPIEAVRENAENYLPGEESWYEQIPADNTIKQAFVPQNNNLNSIGLLLGYGDSPIDSGDFTISIEDKDSNTVWSKTFSYDTVTLGSYWDFGIDASLKKGKKYFLCISAHNFSKDAVPSIGLCPSEYKLKENKYLTYSGSLSAQMITRYRYSNVLPTGKAVLLEVVFAVICGAFLLLNLIKIPEKIWKWYSVVLPAVCPAVIGLYFEKLLNEYPEYWGNRARMVCLLVLYAFEIVALLLTNSVKIGLPIFAIVTTALYTTEFYVYSFRGTHFRFNDFHALQATAAVASHYNYSPTVKMTIGWCICILFVLLAVSIQRKLQKTGIVKRIILFASGVVLAATTIYVLIGTNFLKAVGIPNRYGFAQEWSYVENGFLVSFCYEIKNNKIVTPDNYSDKYLSELAQDNPAQDWSIDRDDLPHVILIMNESFSDLRVNGNLALNQDCMPFINSLTDNTVKGTVNVSVFGGGTANSEFEVLTGCTTAFLPYGYYPYTQLINHDTTSLVTKFRDNGYNTYSLHPYSSNSWNRNKVYPYLGFEDTDWGNHFVESDRLHTGVSDAATYRHIEKVFEQSKAAGEKMFFFEVTIQNHGPYTDSDIDQQVWATNVNNTEVNTFLSLMYESDKALKELVEYFEKEDEKVVICMFGDHQPRTADNNFYQQIYNMTDNLTDTDKLLNKYKTPFVIWANYDIQEKQDVDISLNYLGLLLSETAGLPLSSLETFLSKQIEQYPIITTNGYVDSQGNYYSWENDSSCLNDYRVFQYGYLVKRKTEY